MGIFDAASRAIVGKLGKAIDVAGRIAANVGIKGPEKNLSESLQSYGGAKPGSPYVYVPPVNATSLDAGGQSTVRQSIYTPPPVSKPQPKPPTIGGGQQQVQQTQQQEQSQFQMPSIQESVPSAEEAANRAAEERMRRFGEVVAPVQRDVEAYLTNRPSITDLYNTQLAEQGIPGKQNILSGLESQQSKLLENIATIPEEDIQRRKETGMLTAAAERRIRAQQALPYQEQLTKVTGAKESERVGLERAFNLVDKYLDVLREQEQRGMEPLQARLTAAQGEFKNETDALAQRLTGFNADREAKLKEYEAAVDAGLKLTLAQRKEASDLKMQELEHLNAMEEIAAKNKGETLDFDKADEILSMQSRIAEGATSGDIVKEFVRTGLLDISTVEKALGKNNDVLSANQSLVRE